MLHRSRDSRFRRGWLASIALLLALAAHAAASGGGAGTDFHVAAGEKRCTSRPGRRCDFQRGAQNHSTSQWSVACWAGISVWLN